MSIYDVYLFEYFYIYIIYIYTDAKTFKDIVNFLRFGIAITRKM